MGLIDVLNPKTMSRCQSFRLNEKTDSVELGSPTRSAQHSEKKKKKKRVGFVSRIAIRKHASRRDMTPEEIQAAWFSREEFTAITQSCEDLLHILDQEGQTSLLRRDTQYHFRGLESNTRICLAAKLQNRADAFRAVLDEQDSQLMGASPVDDEAIRKAYQGVSSSAQLWAHTVGLHDQREAEDIMDEFLSSLQTSTRTIPGIVASPLTSPMSNKISNSSLSLRRRPRTGILALARVKSMRAIVAAATTA